MRLALLTIITLLPTYLIRFHIGPIPTTFLELLLLSTFLYWCAKKIKECVGGDSGIVTERHMKPARAWFRLWADRGWLNKNEQAAGAQRVFARDNPLAGPLILFVLAATVSVFIAPDLRAALGLWRAYIVEPILFFFMMTDTIKRGWPTVWRDVTIALSLSALGVALPAIYQKFDPIGIPNIYWAAAATRRVTSWYGFPNAIGLYLAPIVIFLIGGIIMRGRHGDAAEDERRGTPAGSAAMGHLQAKRRDGERVAARRSEDEAARHDRTRAVLLCILYSFAALASLLAILFARSEGAIASLLVVGFIVGMLSSRTRLWVAVITLVFVIATFTNTPWRDYVYEQIAFHGDSGKVRIQQWKETVRMLRDHPILGAGLSGYPKTVAPYHKQKHIEIYQYPHNIILNFWSEMGIAGVIAFFWLVVIFFRKTLSPPFRGGARGGAMRESWGSYDPMIVSMIAAMAVILIHGLVDVPYFKNDLAIFFWLLLALSTIDKYTQSASS